METMESLLSKNSGFEHNHGLTGYDLDKVNEIISVIEMTRTASEPKPGDRIVCKGPNKIYALGHMELPYTREHAVICVQPYVPFTSIHTSKDGSVSPWFNTSGGYWLSCQDRDMYEFQNTCKKMFCTWGHKGPCAGGAVNFEAEVNVWELFKESIY